MTSTAVRTSLADALSAAHAAVDTAVCADLELASADELLDGWRELERLRNRLAALESGLIETAQRQQLPARFGARNVVALLRGLLRVDARTAAARVQNADATQPCLTPTGHVRPAVLPSVASAQAAGSISPDHARVIRRAVESLPDVVRAELGGAVEHELVGYAHTMEPRLVAVCGDRIRAHHDPDGALTDVAQRHRQRGLDITQRRDGSARLHGELTAECTEHLLALLDPLSAPKPAAAGVPDRRSATQRRHDGLLDLLLLVGRSRLAPDSNGVTSTVILTATAEEWTSGAGFTRTGHGALVPTAEARRWAAADSRTMGVATDERGAIEGWTDARRLFTESQRLAMIARDRGCTFPGCDMPPAMCEAHHLTDHDTGGPTTTDNGGLVCSTDHREQIAEGWRAEMIGGRVAWIPPAWVDPEQRPRVNVLHHPERATHDEPP